ncbi:Uncharacterised protein [Paucimonas lemoignei]|nr:Uncharacterised protein [Paucimonas lemoignei]
MSSQQHTSRHHTTTASSPWVDSAQDLQQLKKASVAFLLFISLICAAFGLIYLDVAVAHTQLLETSFTEIAQELMLATCAVLFWANRGAVEQKSFNALAGGLFACMFIRELDGLFDPISHSFWLWPALATAAVCLFKGFGTPRSRANSISALARFSRSSGFSMIVAGFGVLVFSRIFGMGTLWHQILQEGYQRMAKTMVEEGLELIAYCIFLTGSLQYYFQQSKVSQRI